MVTQDNQNARKRTLDREDNIILLLLNLRKKRLGDPLHDVVVVEFHWMVSKGPEYICTFCTQMFLRHYVIIYMNRTSYKPNLNAYCMKGKVLVIRNIFANIVMGI